ncbi:MAG: YCF48-related protein [Bacteroidales bacterium]|nr:YCF48-related protein [Bacteroidales bacterium]
MKITTILSVIAFVLVFTACEDDTNDNPRGSWASQQVEINERLNDISFADELQGWIAGHNNTLLHTVDGETWKHANINDGNTYNFLTVHFINGQDGFIGGEDITNNEGIIFHTRNGGSSWNRIAPGGDIFRIKKIVFADENTGYALGGNNTLLKTTNGGSSWNSVHVFDNEVLEDIAVSGSNLWTCGRDDAVLYSSDAGSSWMNRNTGDSEQWLNSIFFLNSNTGYTATAYGEAHIYKTSDSGSSWETSFSAPEAYISDIFFTDENTGWISAENNIVLYYQRCRLGVRIIVR